MHQEATPLNQGIPPKDILSNLKDTLHNPGILRNKGTEPLRAMPLNPAMVPLQDTLSSLKATLLNLVTELPLKAMLNLDILPSPVSLQPPTELPPLQPTEPQWEPQEAL